MPSHTCPPVAEMRRKLARHHSSWQTATVAAVIAEYQKLNKCLPPTCPSVSAMRQKLVGASGGGSWANYWGNIATDAQVTFQYQQLSGCVIGATPTPTPPPTPTPTPNGTGTTSPDPIRQQLAAYSGGDGQADYWSNVASDQQVADEYNRRIGQGGTGDGIRLNPLWIGAGALVLVLVLARR